MILLPAHTLDIPPLPQPRELPALSRPAPPAEPGWLSITGRGRVEYGIGGPRSERTFWGRFLLGLKWNFSGVSNERPTENLDLGEGRRRDEPPPHR